MQMIIDWLNQPLLTALGATLSVVEGVGFVTGLLAVWLTARRNIWNFPIGIANGALLFLLFFDARLFADAGLQIMFIILGFAGWWFWLTGGVSRRKTIRAATMVERLGTALAVLLLVGSLYAFLTWVKGSIPVLDALITSLSIVAQWLLNRKILETWLLWIATDIISIPVYLYKELYLIALLYAVFLVLACRGYQLWRQEMLLSQGRAVPRAALATE
ncbi:nicotinamide riboside transporter PnuC [Dongia mobilis]|uniref:nicotinamide riboside transporter PnuC n=1 Tax=Dongia sp. TaxID=1977262 RepID=UPI0026EB9DDD